MKELDHYQVYNVVFINMLINELVYIDVDFVWSHILTGFDDHYFERN